MQQTNRPAASLVTHNWVRFGAKEVLKPALSGTRQLRCSGALEYADNAQSGPEYEMISPSGCLSAGKKRVRQNAVFLEHVMLQ